MPSQPVGPVRRLIPAVFVLALVGVLFVAARLPESPGCAFVCGSNAFVDIAVDAALALGLEAGAIKTERYGA